jgi:hypothetical protein
MNSRPRAYEPYTYMHIVSYVFRLFNDVDVAVCEGRRQLDRYGCRWEDNIEVGLKDMECWCCLGLSGPE